MFVCVSSSLQRDLTCPGPPISFAPLRRSGSCVVGGMRCVLCVVGVVRAGVYAVCIGVCVCMWYLYACERGQPVALVAD